MKLLQTGISGATYEGGCPFKDFDMSALKNLLHASLTEDETQKFVNNVSIKDPEVLCTAFLKLVRKDDINDVVIKSPVQYYQKMVD